MLRSCAPCGPSAGSHPAPAALSAASDPEVTPATADERRTTNPFVTTLNPFLTPPGDTNDARHGGGGGGGGLTNPFATPPSDGDLNSEPSSCDVAVVSVDEAGQVAWRDLEGSPPGGEREEVSTCIHCASSAPDNRPAPVYSSRSDSLAAPLPSAAPALSSSEPLATRCSEGLAGLWREAGGEGRGSSSPLRGEGQEASSPPRGEGREASSPPREGRESSSPPRGEERVSSPAAERETLDASEDLDQSLQAPLVDDAERSWANDCLRSVGIYPPSPATQPPTSSTAPPLEEAADRPADRQASPEPPGVAVVAESPPQESASDSERLATQILTQLEGSQHSDSVDGRTPAEVDAVDGRTPPEDVASADGTPPTERLERVLEFLGSVDSGFLKDAADAGRDVRLNRSEQRASKARSWYSEAREEEEQEEEEQEQEEEEEAPRRRLLTQSRAARIEKARTWCVTTAPPVPPPRAHRRRSVVAAIEFFSCLMIEIIGGKKKKNQ